MTVDLKWRDAMAIASWAFKTHAEHAAGWPENMTPHQLAALQRPWVRTEPASKLRCEALILAIHADCDADRDRLPHTTTSHVEQKQWSKQIPVRFDSMYWDGAHGKIRTVRGVTDVEVKTHHIAAAPFAEWLRTQGEEPSQYIAHWFKVRGVAAGAQVLELVQPASAADAAAKPAQDATNDQWWLTWCSERIAANTKPDGSRKEGKARTPWTDDDVRVFDLRLSTLIGRGQAESAAKNAIASDLKTSVQALRLPLEKRDALQVNANNQQSRKVN